MWNPKMCDKGNEIGMYDSIKRISSIPSQTHIIEKPDQRHDMIYPSDPSI